MEKIFSTRLDEKLIHQINVIAARKAISNNFITLLIRIRNEGLCGH